ncbi:hypothetical protein B9G39_18405 [Zooshikella ganghwensis]|uniref:CcmD family protein n=1 Tax=Zooshikella ganghwensis TaxID=202772 RepID=A0A4P9VP46_9GAMM|nr:hypothetical protein B9G39_18405 [Zooshikella ganghwensis]
MLIRLFGYLVCILCSSAIMSLPETELGTTVYYTLLVFINLFIFFCVVTILNLNERVKKLEKINRE